MARLHANILGVVACLVDAAVVVDVNVGLDDDIFTGKDQIEANLSSVASAEVVSAVDFSATHFLILMHPTPVSMTH